MHLIDIIFHMLFYIKNFFSLYHIPNVWHIIKKYVCVWLQTNIALLFATVSNASSGVV